MLVDHNHVLSGTFKKNRSNLLKLLYFMWLKQAVHQLIKTLRPEPWRVRICAKIPLTGRQRGSVSLKVAGLLIAEGAITAEVGCSKTAVFNFFKDDECYVTKRSSGSTQTINLCWAGGTDGLSMKTQTNPRPKYRGLTMDADCRTITKRRHQREKGLKNKNLAVCTLQRSTKQRTLNGGRKFYSLMRKK